ncbi:hypothetical protein PFICI_08645 [Pestalotiopsis fici W106-1]|uniref:Uncharacterized protein n=1 Tax=Pestalotiopsis fici (strain W106-1 / CGMCC3.15140) TaxID=1229662 RepID=W3X0B4_PESFW|nr:uncharacterized protein PFICI_08645 [Pestalotiopsis fici W106-1]ETS78792.1 hypothetical protein PFICI_08645 [Pestalotiopsis fici W106-1]
MSEPTTQSPSAGDPPPYILVEVPQGTAPERYVVSDEVNKPSLGLPALPTRPLSAPPAPVPEEKPAAGQYAASISSVPGTGGNSTPTSPVPAQSPDGTNGEVIVGEEEAEKSSHFAKRFMGNMLVARLGRAGVQSVSSTVKLPLYLSPWGDNNPFVLPNLRKRDLALAGVMHFGADALIGSSLTAVETVVAHGATWTAEQSVDQGYDKLRGGNRPHSVKRTAGLTSVEIRIKHKLIGEEAELRFFESKGTRNALSCAKGWFCPYLYCSSRVSQLSRLKDFTVAEVMGPGLKADAALAPTLLSCITNEDAPLCRLDAGEDAGTTSTNYKRFAIFFMGMSPYRTASTWSQAKVPGEARIRFHLLTHIPAIVVPIKSAAPVCAWSPWTLDQMVGSKDGYTADSHREEILRYLDTVIDATYMREQSQQTWRQELGAALDQILAGTRNISSTLGSIADAFENEYGGIVMFRF